MKDAEERDALAGNTTEAAKVAAYRKATRDKNNEVEAAFDALIATSPSMSEVQAFNESWKRLRSQYTNQFLIAIRSINTPRKLGVFFYESQPSSRSSIRDYCLRQLGFPVLEINVDDDQVDDAIDDALQYYRERHYDGVEHMYLKHLFTAADETKFETSKCYNYNRGTDWEENRYIDIPPHVMGISRVLDLQVTQLEIIYLVLNIKFF